jgi:hypothetical protein
MPFFVRVRGVWDGSPSIYWGPFNDYESALAAVARSGADMDAPAVNPGRDVVITVLTDEEARASGLKERHILPPAGESDSEEAFEVPANWAEFTRIFYRRFGYH